MGADGRLRRRQRVERREGRQDSGDWCGDGLGETGKSSMQKGRWRGVCHGGGREDKWGAIGASSNVKGWGGARIGGMVGIIADEGCKRRWGVRCGNSTGSGVKGGGATWRRLREERGADEWIWRR